MSSSKSFGRSLGLIRISVRALLFAFCFLLTASPALAMPQQSNPQVVGVTWTAITYQNSYAADRTLCPSAHPHYVIPVGNGVRGRRLACKERQPQAAGRPHDEVVEREFPFLGILYTAMDMCNEVGTKEMAWATRLSAGFGLCS